MNRFYSGLILLFLFCLGATMLVFSSCEDEDSVNAIRGNDPTVMRGFFLSVNQNGETDCTGERINVYIDEGADLEQRPNVRFVDTLASGDFPGLLIQHFGIRVADSSEGEQGIMVNPETIVTAYSLLTSENNINDRPGSYFLNLVPDSDIPGKVYAGYWTGYAYRPDEEPRPNVVCPYVLVTDGLRQFENVPMGQCGVNINDPIHEDLEKYFRDTRASNEILRPCYEILNDQGMTVFPPTPRDISPEMGVECDGTCDGLTAEDTDEDGLPDCNC